MAVVSNVTYKVGDNIRHDVKENGVFHSYVGVVEDIKNGEAIVKVKEYGVNGKVQKNKPKRVLVKLR